MNRFFTYRLSDKLSCKLSLYSLSLLLMLFALLKSSIAFGAPDCTADALISETFSNGAKWEMCWESRIRENLVLSDVYYTPPNGVAKRVLSTARLSQLHVAYDDSDVTYNDITQYGLGGGYMVSLDQSDCPLGKLLTIQTRPGVCHWRSQGNDNYRTPSRSVSAESLTLFSVSQVGAYAYIVTWKFFSDGAISPEVGATGALQRSSENTELPFGRLLSGSDKNLWLSHTHNYYWRLDFDLGDNANDDVVTESRTLLQDTGQRETVVQRFATEQARVVDPKTPMAWEIWDNLLTDTPGADDSGYRIEPIRYGHRLERKEKEPYTEFDFFVTVANDCERFASQNARFNPDCLNNVAQYANGESLLSADLVLWHRVSFHHVPRDEDQRHMHTHWDGFTIEPLNIHKNTPGINIDANSAPSLDNLDNRNDQLGTRIVWQLVANDVDGDGIAFEGTNLPDGLALNYRGVIEGTPTVPGNYTVTIKATDDIATTEKQFNWVIDGKGGEVTSRGFLGSTSAVVLLLFSLIVLTRIFNRIELTQRRS